MNPEKATEEMEAMKAFRQLPLSPGLTSAVEKIEKFEHEKKPDEAEREILKSLDMVRISGALLRYKLANHCHQKGDNGSTKALFVKAIEHLNKKNPAEQRVIDAIKREMAKIPK